MSWRQRIQAAIALGERRPRLCPRRRWARELRRARAGRNHSPAAPRRISPWSLS